MAYYNFREDLKRAKETEREVMSLLSSLTPDATIEDGPNTVAYDFLLLSPSEGEIKVEVKEDFIAARTGNVAVEFASRGKPSGLWATEADLWVYKIHHRDKVEFYSIPTKTLKQAVEDEKYFRIVVGGDKGSMTYMFLFKLEEFKKFANLLSTEMKRRK